MIEIFSASHAPINKDIVFLVEGAHGLKLSADVGRSLGKLPPFFKMLNLYGFRLYMISKISHSLFVFLAYF